MSTQRDPAKTSRIMAAVRGRDTRPELLLRRALHRRGLRYRTEVHSLIGKPDIVFPRARVVVFVDGDFWHGKGWKARGFASFEDQFRHRNGDWWRQKIERNVARDAKVNRVLRREGWKVIRVLESQLLRDVERVAERITREAKSRV